MKENFAFAFAVTQCEWTLNENEFIHHVIQIRDGMLDTDPLLNRWCSSDDPAPVQTTGPYARVFFHTDYSNTDTGFHINYASIGGTCSLTSNDKLIALHCM